MGKPQSNFQYRTIFGVPLIAGNCKYTPLHYASIWNNKDIVELLIESNANVNVKDYLGYTPFSYALERGNQEIIQLLKEHGAKI